MSDGLADLLRVTQPVVAAGQSDHDWALVVERDTGICWTAQVGGYACQHPCVEGFLVPLGRGPITELGEYFYGDSGPWRGWCDGGINADTATWLDGRLPPGLSVDRGRLDEGREAWIPVRGTLDSWLADNVGTITGFLTWENSD